MKRNLIVVVILLLVLAAGGIYFYFSGKEMPFQRDTSVYKGIPVSAPFFFEFSSAKAVNMSHPVIHELTEAGIGHSWFNFLSKTDSLITNSDNLPKSLLNSSFILTYGFAGRNQLIPLIIRKAEGGTQHQMEVFLNTMYPPSAFPYHHRDYGKHTITEISGKHSQGPIYYSFAGGLLLVSPNSIIIEQVIRQMATPGILKNPYFREVNKRTGSQGISFFINHANLNGFFGNILNRNVTERIDEFGSTVRYQPASQAAKFREYAGWSQLGFRFGNNVLNLNGISAADDSLNHFLPVFEGQQSVRFRAEEVLPQNTSFFCSFSFSDKKTFFERLEEFFAHSPQYYHREERMKRFDGGMRSNLRKAFQEMVRDEVIVATTAIPVNPENKTVYFIAHTSSRSGAEDQLKKLLSNYALRTGTDAEQLTSQFSVDGELHFPVYRFPYPSFPGLWMGSPFSMVNARFVTFYDNFMVFSNTEQGLHEYLRNMVLGTTLAKNARYQQFRQQSSNRANMNVFIDVNKAYGLRTEIFPASLLKLMEDKEESIRRFGMLNWQVQRNKGFFHNALAISYLTDFGEEAHTAWQSVIGNNISVKPQLVVNHSDAASREIIFQDSQNMLYHVSGTGRVRWSIKLQGPVMGEIHQIDYYQNGRLQYLFNTREKIYLIDRNGKNVAHFPVDLRSPATNGLNVFDYHNNRNYRYFVAGEDKKIYAYDQAGKIVSGWTFDKTEHEVTTPVQYFRVDGKDYIVFKDKSKIYILDRQGDTRVSPTVRFNNSGNRLVLSLIGNPKIIGTDTNGKVYYVYFDGKVEERKTSRFSENHFFAVDDLDGNGVLEFVFVDGSELTVIDEKGKKLFSRKLNNPVRYQPNIYTFSPNLKKIGVVDAITNRIYLFNPDGKQHEGFPLQGNSEFSIGKLSESATSLSLIVGSEDGMLYNYSLN
jgi:hypothetical protein